MTNPRDGVSRRMGRVEAAGYRLARRDHVQQASVRVVSAEIHRTGCYLLVQRGAHASLPLLWEFPGGRVRRGETDREALTRALIERIGCEGAVGELLMEVIHSYADVDLTLAVYRCDIGTSTPTPGKIADLAWVAPDRFSQYTFPGADQKTVDLLLADDITGEAARPPGT